MKILFIDNFSPEGHIQFNRIQIKALCNIGEVYTAMKKGYFEKIGVDQAHKLIEIPDNYYIYENNMWMAFLNRFFTRLTSHNLLKERTLNYVRKHIEDNWDAIVFSHFEPLPLYRMKSLHNVYAISHQYKLLISSGERMTKINNRIKFTQKVGEKYTIIALSDEMRKGIEILGIKKVEVVPHGFIAMNGDIKKSVLEKFGVPDNKKLLFSPSFSNNTILMNELYNNEDFNNYLEYNNFFYIVKDKNGKCNNSNVKVIKDWITEEEYQTLFLSCFCLILPYGDITPYRESGVIMECFANNKPFLKINIPSLNNYNPYIRYESTFYDVMSIMKGLDLLLSFEGNYFQNIDKISDPFYSWKRLLNDDNTKK